MHLTGKSKDFIYLTTTKYLLMSDYTEFLHLLLM